MGYKLSPRAGRPLGPGSMVGSWPRRPSPAPPPRPRPAPDPAWPGSKRRPGELCKLWTSARQPRRSPPYAATQGGMGGTTYRPGPPLNNTRPMNSLCFSYSNAIMSRNGGLSRRVFNISFSSLNIHGGGPSGVSGPRPTHLHLSHRGGPRKPAPGDGRRVSYLWTRDEPASSNQPS